MSRADDRCELIARCVVQGEVRRKDRGLAVLRFAQLLFGAVFLQMQEIVTEYVRCALEKRARRLRRFRDVGAHPNDLRPLARKDRGDSHAHLHVTAPHDRPPPNPTKTITSPGVILPLSSASESAIGIEAADVFPYSSMLMMTLSSGMSRYF